jgi:hypothetical protein
MQELFSEEGMAGFDLAQYVYAFFLLTSASLLMDEATKRDALGMSTSLKSCLPLRAGLPIFSLFTTAGQISGGPRWHSLPVAHVPEIYARWATPGRMTGLYSWFLFFMDAPSHAGEHKASRPT